MHSSMCRCVPRLTVLKAWCHAQHDFFWSMLPQPTPEDKMPKREASHELDMKRKRQAERGQRQDVSPLSASRLCPPCASLRMSYMSALSSEREWPSC